MNGVESTFNNELCSGPGASLMVNVFDYYPLGPE